MVVEGNSGTVDAVFVVTLNQPGDQTVTVNYTTSDSSATTPADYQTTSGTLTFAPGGPTSQNIVVKVVGDTLQENNEQFGVTLNTPVNATLVSNASAAVGHVVDDDQATLSIQNVNVAEGDAGTTNAVFTVTRSGSTAGTTTVNYATAPFTATTPADFATASGTLTFGPGETAKTITVAVAGDTLQELTEMFGLNLSSPVNGTVVNGNATGAIVDDDASAFTIEGGIITEGDAVGGDLAFTVRRHGSLDGPASVRYQTANSSAVSGPDFIAASGLLNFAAGEATRQVPVTIVADMLQEPAEIFSVNLSQAENASIADNSAQGTIVDNDAVSWTVEGSAVVEGDTGTTAMEFKVRRYGQVAGAASINYATTNNSATTPADYVAANGTLNFAAGESVKTVTVLVNGETLQEGDEVFHLNISAPSTGTAAENAVQGVIIDDDRSFLTIIGTDVGVIEGDSGTTAATFTVTRHGSLDGVSTVNYATSNNSAVTPSDYVVANGTLTFNPGEATKTITINVNGDTTAEGNEYFSVNLSAPINATIAQSTGFTWIANDDGTIPTAYFFLGEAAVTEGDAGTTAATFTVRRFGDTSGPDTVNYSINAPTGGDYQVASGTLSFAAGETSKTFSINVVGDTDDEPVEQFSLTINSPTAGSIVADSSGLLNVVDEDKIALWVEDASIAEGDNPAGQNVRLTVRRFGETGGQTTVNFTTQNSSAMAPQDFNVASGTLTFASGDDTKEILVRVLGDATQENTESFFVNLASPVNGTIVGGNSQAMIFDDDLSFVAVNDVTVVEGSGAAGANAVFNVTRYGSTDGQATVNYNTANFSAVSPGDYAATSGTLTFDPGETSKTVSVPVVSDTTSEVVEQFFFDLSAPNNVTPVRTRGIAKIVDDDNSAVVMSGVAVVEGDTGARDAVFTLTRYGSLSGASTVEFRATNASAVAPGDYTQLVQVVTFAPGESTKTVTVEVIGDVQQEGNEVFGASLSAPVNTSLPGAGNNTGTILDDDASFLYIDNTIVEEGNPASPRTAVFTVRRIGSLDGQATVNFATSNSSATTPADYAITSGTLTFAPGEASKPIAIPIMADTTREAIEELFFVNLNTANNATIVDGSGRGVILDDDPAPTVTQVYFSGTRWGGDDGNPNNTTFKEFLRDRSLGSVLYGYAIPGGGDQLRTLPWINMNRVSITFSQDVLVDKEDLAVRGANTASYSFAEGADGFSYDAPTRTATWTFAQILTRDRLLLDLDSSTPSGVHTAGNEYLDGEWSNGGDAYPSGNGVGGGDFLFRANILPGDADRNTARVATSDINFVKARLNRSSSEAAPPPGLQPYTPFADIDASTRIATVDINGTKARLNTVLPDPAPTGIVTGIASITRELFGRRAILG